MPELDRTQYCGGSDQADLLGIAPYGCYRRLILGKRDRIELDLSDNIHVLRGQYLEPAAAQLYSDRTGRKLRNQQRWADKDTRMGMAMDRHIVAFDDRGPGVLEIKCPSSMTFRRYLREGAGADYSCQLNWYMGMSGWRWGSFAFVNFETDPGLLSFDVDFDAELFEMQKARAAEAWKLVEFGPLPDKLDPKSKPCARCQYFDTCHPNETPAEDTGELVQISTPELASAIADYAAAHEVASEAEALKEQAKAQIKALIGDATAVDAPGARVYHRTSARETVDSKLLKKQYPEAAQACSKTTTIKTLRIYERH
jgi:predicted phage-related endonuclease